VDAFVRVLNFALRGTGATKPATAIPFAVQWLVQLPLMWLVGLRLHMGMTGIVTLQVALSVVEALVFAFVWQRGSWKALQFGASARAGAIEHIGRPERIVILGGAGAGKSTLARRIGERLDLSVIHLDRCIYGPNWTRLPPEVSRAKVVAALGERWVIDGTYPQFHDLTLAHADLVLWIEQPAWKRLWRAWHKTRLYRGQPRADRPDGCEEAFGLRSLLTVLRFGRWSNAVGTRLQQQTPGRVLRLRGDKDVKQFVETLQCK
jgi:adenylate kinase family enzyme